MRIGFDISQTGQNKAGCGYLAYSLIRALAEIDEENEYIQYPTFGDFFFDPDWKRTIEFVNQDNFHKGLGHNNLEEAKDFWNNPNKGLEKSLGEPDIIQSNNFYCPHGLRSAKLIYVLYDLGFIEYPDLTTEANRIGCFNGVFRASIYADHIISISEYSKRYFLKTFPHYPEENITVVPLASRFLSNLDEQIQKPYNLSGLVEDRFWFNLGTLEPRKNQIGLLEAYAKHKEDFGEVFPLVIGGGKGWLLDNFELKIKELGLQNDVIIVGYVDEQSLIWLYRNCFAFVFPSLFEGFGLPVLEAMSQGAAVIASNVTSIPEVVGNAGVLIDPNDPESLWVEMKSLVSGKINRKFLKDAAIQRAAEFSWRSVGDKVLAIYKQLM